MASIDFRPFDETEDLPTKSGPPGLGTSARLYFMGNETDPQLFEVTVPPGVTVPSHAHELDEIMYITQGEVHFGKRVLPAGSSVYIPGRTLYSFKAGPQGLRFLNFRGTSDRTYYSKEEFMALRGAGGNNE